MKHSHATLLFFTCLSSTAYAAPNDLFLETRSKQDDSTLKVAITLDSVNQHIDFFDLRSQEGMSDSSAGDYFGGSLTAKYAINTQWQIEGAYWHREIDLAPDTNNINTSSIALRYSPAFLLTDDSALDFKLSFWTNQASALTKSSKTTVNSHTFNRVTVFDPKDYQIQFDSILSHKLNDRNTLTGFGSIGYSKVKTKKLQVQASQYGCLVNLNIDSSNQLSSELAEKCIVDGFIVEEIQIFGDAKSFGLDIDKDLNYDSYYAGLGGSWNWKYNQFETQLAYQYQHFWRKDIDDRIGSFGSSPIKDNHSLGLKLNYEITPKVTAFIKGEIYKNNFVGYIPFLYNGVTASRLDKKYGLASLGIEFNVF